ncbi:serine/threonine-protein kinase S6KL-like isoform X2 [Zootermopsis nevadensis]|uniref:serine/threonine-protein kinase S6KL-like isoform X2 n=1 Tax=Zootermopsis nevadensis TaxID=136037 RepID=UPI000B8E7097|nr:serine/threonine-protein kinase S6KL-like isoform X2 [Zootermopsis nevadensis]
MGNSSRKHASGTTTKHLRNVGIRQPYTSQISLSNFTSDLSGRSFASAVSYQSTCSVSRPWSRVSRRRWRQTTLSDPLEAAKTAWPVSYVEAVFLPEFKIKGDITERDFQVISTISRGAFGKVYKVVKKDTNEIYALKILSKSQIISENAVQQVKDEVGIQSMCGHNPFIVNCPFFWQNRKQLFIVSEFVSGGELLELCQSYGILPEELVRIYVAEISLALDFLHNAGVIYRDIKLENILLDDEGHAQLIDFGLAKWIKYGSRTTTICGTRQYMAPEVVSMEPYGHAVDWWSLGVVACCMLSGQFPLAAVGIAVSDQKVPGSLPVDCSFSPAAKGLLQRLLEPDPQSRLRSLLALQGIAFFKDFSFADARAKKPSDIFTAMRTSNLLRKIAVKITNPTGMKCMSILMKGL